MTVIGATAGGCAVLGHQCIHQFGCTTSSLSLSISNRFTCKGSVKQRSFFAIQARNGEDPFRRPNAPGSVPSTATSSASSSPSSEPSLSPPSSQSLSSSPAAAKVKSGKSSAVSIEYQRQRAKELQEYFLDKKYEEQVRAERIFGWTLKNEILNGRWSMFGIAVG